MTRPKVPPEQRQRTAQACDSCKRRKQKCNGICPCNTCEKRNFTCIYSERDASSPSDQGRPAKKRVIDGFDRKQPDSPNVNDCSTSNTPTNGPSNNSPISHPARASPLVHHHLGYDAREHRAEPLSVKHEHRPFHPSEEGPTAEVTATSLQHIDTGQASGQNPGLRSRGTTVQSGLDEEAVVYTQSRMLQDPTGRLLYVGDSATLSFLQLLRMMVENVAGTSPFTNDPARHKIVEGQFSLPAGFRHTYLLPDQTTARVLVDAFFINTHGLLQIFERQSFLEDIDRCYTDPLSTDSSWLCLLNLVFSIGLTMATPLSGSPEAVIIDKLRSEHLDRAEVFYLNAKSLNDPMTGFEDQDFWSVQALLLMAVYMLAKSKRNTSFALIGMAARSALALGLHREETMTIYGQEEQTARRNLWRSLFVIDRLLACSLGRPTAISEDDCSGDTLHPADPPLDLPYNLNGNSTATFSETGACALEAAVRSCSVIGLVLRKVYQRRKINTRLAQEIADICKQWPRALPPYLHWRQAASASASQGVAILHVNMFYCHSIILLTRPFFLYILNLETQRQASQAETGARGPRPYLRMEKFSEACVIASTHTILLVNNTFDAGYLSRRNPAVIYFLFAAALVILANEFASLYHVDASDTCILNAITIMNYCAESDQQAGRLLYILGSFREVVAAQRLRRTQTQPETINLPSISSQLYGVTLPNQDLNPGVPIGSSEQTATPRLHQVPIHIYPGMQTTPLPSDSNSKPTFQPPPSLSVHLSPIQNPPVSGSGLSPTSTLNRPLSQSPSLSNALDLSALDATRVPSLYPEESGAPDEHIDFDALWAWPTITPAFGSPRVPGDGSISGGVVERIQGVSDSPVPLFGVVRNGIDGLEP